MEEDIKRCKELIKPEHSNWIGISNQIAIENVLKELAKRDKCIMKLKNLNKRLMKKR